METKPRKVMVYADKYDSKNNEWIKIENGTGYFLAFGIDSDSGSNASFSVAIVEMPDGMLKSISIGNIRFIKG